jgi:hypothetical protein
MMISTALPKVALSRPPVASAAVTHTAREKKTIHSGINFPALISGRAGGSENFWKF